MVLEYLIKSGSDRVSQQCKENMFSIETLKDFQFLDKDGKDQGATSECMGVSMAVSMTVSMTVWAVLGVGVS